MLIVSRALGLKTEAASPRMEEKEAEKDCCRTYVSHHESDG